MRQQFSKNIQKVKVITIVAGTTVIATLIVPLSYTKTQASTDSFNENIIQVANRESINLEDSSSLKLDVVIPNTGFLYDFFGVTPKEFSEIREKGITLKELSIEKEKSLDELYNLVDNYVTGRWLARLKANVISQERFEKYIDKKAEVISDFISGDAKIENLAFDGKALEYSVQ